MAELKQEKVETSAGPILIKELSFARTLWLMDQVSNNTNFYKAYIADEADWAKTELMNKEDGLKISEAIARVRDGGARDPNQLKSKEE